MGNEKSKNGGGVAASVDKKGLKLANKHPNDLNKKDYDYLTQQTGLSKDDIKGILQQFVANNPDGELDMAEFVNLYMKLRPEKPETLDEISKLVFRAFDADNNGRITFCEFLIAYALTSRSDEKKKLEYAFELYDGDNNGYLDRKELKIVIYGMLDLIVNLSIFYHFQRIYGCFYGCLPRKLKLGIFFS
jgi:Ca2+-binding EF-hand superfamily protein